MRADCYFCHIKTVQNLVNKFKPTNSTAEEFIFSVHKILNENRELANPMLATLIHRAAKEKLQVKDLYAEEKHLANKILLDNYQYWRDYIDSSNDPFHTAVRLAVIGNIIDYGAHSVKDDLYGQIKSLLRIELKIDKTPEFKEAVQSAGSILYLGDNAGEIFFDRLLIETLGHSNITFVTRGYPVINDVTEEDARLVGIDKLAKIISNGYDAPSTLIDNCSQEFKDAYEQADLIISKGQGNFEGLMNEGHPNTFFLLIAKCNAIAELLGVHKNDMVTTKF